MGFILTSNLLQTSSQADYKTIEIVPALLRSWNNPFVASLSVMPEELYVPVPVFAAGTWVRIRVRAANSLGAGAFCEVPDAIQLMGLPGPVQNLHLQHSNEKICASWFVPDQVGLGKQLTKDLARVPLSKRLVVTRQQVRGGIESYQGQLSQVSSFTPASKLEVATNARLCFPAPPGSSWYFRAVACNQAGCSPFESSPVASFSVPAEPMPPPPPPPPAGSMRIFSVSPSQAPR